MRWGGGLWGQRRQLVPWISLLVLLTRAHVAWAEEPSRADALAAEALSLTEANKWEEACSKYEESLKLAASYSVEYSLAACYEHIRKLGTAIDHYRHVAEAPASGPAGASGPDKASLSESARERVEALAPLVPKLKIVLPQGMTARAHEVIAILDGRRLKPEEISTESPIDAGDHSIEVTLPGKKPWQDTFRVTIGTYPVEVPAEGGPDASPTQQGPIPLGRTEASTAFRVAGGITAGVGVAGIVVGSIFGLKASSKRDDAQAICQDSDPKLCHASEGLDVWRDARSAGTISTISFVAGGALIATGAVLWIVAPQVRVRSGASHSTSIAVRLVPELGKTSSLQLQGVF